MNHPALHRPGIQCGRDASEPNVYSSTRCNCGANMTALNAGRFAGEGVAHVPKCPHDARRRYVPNRLTGFAPIEACDTKNKKPWSDVFDGNTKGRPGIPFPAGLSGFAHFATPLRPRLHSRAPAPPAYTTVCRQLITARRVQFSQALGRRRRRIQQRYIWAYIVLLRYITAAFTGSRLG